MEHVEIADEEGQIIDRAELMTPRAETEEETPVEAEEGAE